MLIYKSLQPAYGDNYQMGYIGFIHHFEPGFVSKGIAYFQGPPAYGDIRVTHALVVVGDNTCVEANPSGVEESSLSKYFDDETLAIVFRKPRNWHPSMGQLIADEARTHIGDKYAYSLIVAQALAKSKLGRLLNNWFKNKPDSWVSKFLDKGNIQYCSELAAKSLKAVPELRNQGILQADARTIDVQELFGSKAVFEDWK